MKSQWLQKDSYCLKLHLNFNKWFGTVLLLFVRYATLMYVDCINRYLSEMQLHNLPPGIFDGNTKLRFLWVTFICRYDFLNSGLPTSESYTLFKNLRYVKFKGEKKSCSFDLILCSKRTNHTQRSVAANPHTCW